MREYYEAAEKASEEGEEPDFIRIDITDLDDSEREVVLKLMEEQMKGNKYVLKIHYCRHDEDGMCSSKIIKEVE